MTESDTGNKSKVIVGDSKKGGKKSKLIIVAIFICFVVAGGTSLALYIKHQHDKKFVKIDGQTYKLNLATPSAVKYSPSPTDQINKEIQDAETKVKQDPSYLNYLLLARLYEDANNKEQAISSYKTAEQFVPKDQYYQATIDYLNSRIQSVEAR